MTTIPLTLRQAGRERGALMPADEMIPCRALIHREAFDMVIDHAEHPNTNHFRGAVREAKRVCVDLCPVREECLQIHGRDYELGVVAGYTDQERADFFGATT